jgi:D-xylose transport system ATP-binding protein
MPTTAATEHSRSPIPDPARAAVLVAEGITKRFPGVLAVDGASFSIAPGEIIGLLGQNGAGKSTLIQILSGVHPAGSYQGKLLLNGTAFQPASVAEAEKEGVAFVPQEVNVAPDLSVAENIFLNAEPCRLGFLDVPLRLARARHALADFELAIDAAAPMRSLDLANQQLVIIARALSKNARLLILDEPTAALTEEEARRLFARMRSLSRRGVAIIFVSHRLGEVFEISDRIVIMRDGRICGTHRTKDVSREKVITAMIGNAKVEIAKPSRTVGAEALSVEGLCVSDPDDEERLRVKDVAFSVRWGEVVGLFGLVGAGCQEAALALYGAWSGKVTGQLRREGEAVSISDPVEAVRHGLGLMAQDRRDTLLSDHSIHDNIGLASLDAHSPWGFLDIGAMRRQSLDLVSQLNIKTTSIDRKVAVLSGGNQQKVQAARWIAAQARILILIDPTRGVDVGARAEIRQIWMELTQAGHAIVLASTDAEELVGVCDRVIVFRHGATVGHLSGSDLDEEHLLRLAANV